MEHSKNTANIWDSYYARTAVLPKPETTEGFMRYIPQNGLILDFGTGSGRWSAAFLRDRPDITIDATDQNMEKATLLPDNWRGQKIKSSFQDFEPEKSYDGIWAFATLFFINKKELIECFHKLSNSLKEGGIISFTMVDDCAASCIAKFHGLLKQDIIDMLKTEHLSLISIEFDEKVAYGPDKTMIPTYSIIAKK